MSEMRLNTPLKSLLLLVLALSICLGLLGLRYLFHRHADQSFLAWNLFLGLIPLLVSFVALLIERQNWKRFRKTTLILFSVLWLVFFPNSSYIFTDFIHLIRQGLPSDNPNARGWANMLVWFDVIMRSLFAFVGHFIGLASLYVMHHLWKKEGSRRLAWVLVGFSCLAAGYGVFMGRFLRWSSWHLFTHPREALTDIMVNLVALDAWAFSIIFGTFLAVSYFFVYVFKKHLFVAKDHL